MKKFLMAVVFVFFGASVGFAEGKAEPSPRAIERASNQASFKRTETPSVKKVEKKAQKSVQTRARKERGTEVSPKK